MNKDCFKTKPESVKVKDSLPRFRQEMGDVKGLLASIEKHGQLHPVIVSRDMELIAGGRRLAACLLGQRDVFCAYHDTVDEFTMREIELEENVQRKSLTPAEEVLAVKELHTIKQKLYGTTQSGRAGGWKLDDTAALLDKTRGSVIDDISLAEAVEMFPTLVQCKSKSEIKKAAKAISKVIAASEANKDHKEFIAQGNKSEQIKMFCDSMESHIKTMESNSVDLLLTDPPYGIDIHDVAIGLGGHTGGENTSTGTTYDDSTDISLHLCKILAKESYRVCKDTAHGFVFTAPEHFYTIRDMFIAVGWKCYIKPMIWVKRSSGQTNVPTQWPSSCYEMILFIRKDNARLVLEGRPDWIQCDPVSSKEKIHQAEKPVILLKELIGRTTLPNSVIYDPCGGSGSSMEAALVMKMIGIYCEKGKDKYAMAVSRMKPLLKEN